MACSLWLGEYYLRNNETEDLGIRLLFYQQCYAHIKFCTVHIEDAATSQWILDRLLHKRSITYRCVFQNRACCLTELIFLFLSLILCRSSQKNILKNICWVVFYLCTIATIAQDLTLWSRNALLSASTVLWYSHLKIYHYVAAPQWFSPL
jgi:hypothetical protein